MNATLESTDMRHSVVLEGCSPTPLASYLKALGVLRLVAEQVDPQARGYWKNEVFVIESKLDEQALRDFFLKVYQPTPIISPWNGRAGFLEGEDGEESKRKGSVVVRRVIESHGIRFKRYREILRSVKSMPVVTRLNCVRDEVKKLEKDKKKIKKSDDNRLKEARSEQEYLKSRLLTSLRAELPDDFVQWLDACMALTEDTSLMSPLLGSGGNEGSMDFSINHLDMLSKLINPDSDQVDEKENQSLDSSLLATPAVTESRGSPGFLSPDGVGGPNMSSGFTSGVKESAWNTILMLEGALLFAASVTRRLGSSTTAGISFPYVVNSVCAGHGGVASMESARPELWVPIWHRPISVPELWALLSEGRTTIGRRAARDGLDMTRATSALGVDRGIFSFQRYGFFERRGKGYYVAAPLRRIKVQRNPAVELLSDLDRDRWLDRFRRVGHGKHAPHQLASLVRRLEDTLFDLAGHRDDASLHVQRTLACLGEIQLYLARSRSSRENCGPVPVLGEDWVTTALAGDDSAELRIAVALAGMYGRRHRRTGGTQYLLPLADHLAPSQQDGRRRWWIETLGHRVVWSNTDLERNLVAVLRRRLLEGVKEELDDKPLFASASAPLCAVAAWLGDGLDSRRIAALVPGLALARVPHVRETAKEAHWPLPAAFAVLKPFFCTDAQLQRAGLLPEGGTLDIPGELVRRLQTGRIDAAVELALRRLRVAGIGTGLRQLETGVIPGRRLLAALLVPLSDSDLKRLMRRIHRPVNTTESSTT